MTVWLDVIGLGEQGLVGLTPEALKALHQAEIIVGSSRQHSLAPNLPGKRVQWSGTPSTMMSVIAEFRGARTVLLVTGDPLWYSAGVRVATEFSADEVRFHPNVSAFQLACARMQWSMQEVETITVHGRPVEHVIPWIAPRAKLVILTSNSESPFHVARLLSREDYSGSALTVLGKIGGPDETRVSGTARDFLENEIDWQIPDFTHCAWNAPRLPDLIRFRAGPDFPTTPLIPTA